MLILVYLSTFLSFIHPVHVSITNIEIGKKEILVNTRVFVDDFELALSQCSGKQVKLNGQKTFPKKIIRSYLQKNIEIYIDDKKLTNSYFIELIEQKDITLSIFFKSRLKDDFQKITIVNKIMFDVYLDQKNMLILVSGQNQYYSDFYYNDYKKTFQL